MSKSPSNRVAFALICDDDHNVLVGIRNDNGKYTIPGGHLEVKEDPFEGVARELKEEAGLDALEMKIVKVTKRGNMVIYVMKITVAREQEIDCSKDPDKECDAWFYIDPNEVADQLHVDLPDNAVLQAWMES